MKDSKSNNEEILNIKILFRSIMASAAKLTWPIGGVGIPAIYFGFEGDWLEMVLLFVGCFVSIQVLYLTACILVTKVKLSDKVEASHYSTLSDKEKRKANS